MDSNLSKIRPKLRTQGNVTGNFGRNKVKSGSPLADIGVTKASRVSIAPLRSYINRMIFVYRNHEDPKLREFAYSELHRLNCFQEIRLEDMNDE